jgi:hypothetical protein
MIAGVYAHLTRETAHQAVDATAASPKRHRNPSRTALDRPTTNCADLESVRTAATAAPPSFATTPVWPGRYQERAPAAVVLTVDPIRR